jgi:hypothetical protein
MSVTLSRPSLRNLPALLFFFSRPSGRDIGYDQRSLGTGTPTVHEQHLQRPSSG